MDKRMGITISKTEDAKDLPLPRYMTSGAVGMDLSANISGIAHLNAGEFKVIPCGIKIELPLGFEAQVRPRSGLAAKYGVTLLNSPGTIDSDFRGEIKVVMINHGKKQFTIKRGDRIAQLIISQVVLVDIIESSHLIKTERGEGGFGHTGI